MASRVMYNAKIEHLFLFMLTYGLTYGIIHIWEKILILLLRTTLHMVVDMSIRCSTISYGARSTGRRCCACRPQFYIPDMIKIMKGNLARRLFIRHPELKKEMWGGHLWNPSYCAVTVSDRSREQVERYILTQKDRA